MRTKLLIASIAGCLIASAASGGIYNSRPLLSPTSKPVPVESRESQEERAHSTPSYRRAPSAIDYTYLRGGIGKAQTRVGGVSVDFKTAEFDSSYAVRDDIAITLSGFYWISDDKYLDPDPDNLVHHGLNFAALYHKRLSATTDFVASISHEGRDVDIKDVDATVVTYAAGVGFEYKPMNVLQLSGLFKYYDARDGEDNWNGEAFTFSARYMPTAKFSVGLETSYQNSAVHENITSVLLQIEI